MVLALFLAFGAGVSAAGHDAFDASQFMEWVESEGVWRTVYRDAFRDGAEFRPTSEEIEAMMRFATMSPTSIGMNDFLWVVLTDVEQQRDVVGEENANEGTITAMIFGDRLLPAEESLGGHVQSVDRGYYNVGISTGYLNLAAISLGYGSRMYMTTQYTMAGSTREQTTEEAYLKDKGYQYLFGFDRFERGDEEGYADAYGNLKFVAAIVIGTLDEEADSTVTDKIYMQNYVIVD